ncbi:hypothetical protein Cgig2_000447 [Carnegiea gigantea]|uniref:Uncharacterized protein n=1 Tax=Carnegiea gigantea TaxID=171969 RepID=A0A9Q1GNW2_9CARY|nr:hypothetical protein Cgig2_000447 [Carnegiea gigantea]
MAEETARMGLRLRPTHGDIGGTLACLCGEPPWDEKLGLRSRKLPSLERLEEERERGLSKPDGPYESSRSEMFFLFLIEWRVKRLEEERERGLSKPDGPYEASRSEMSFSVKRLEEERERGLSKPDGLYEGSDLSIESRYVKAYSSPLALTNHVRIQIKCHLSRLELGNYFIHGKRRNSETMAISEHER